MARFFLALGAVGEVGRAAELAAVDPDRALAWVEGIERPVWLTRRSEAARRLFQIADEALEGVRRQLRGEVADESSPPLRELVNVAERFYSAALKLDNRVGADGPTQFEVDLDGWASQEDPVDDPSTSRRAAASDA